MLDKICRDAITEIFSNSNFGFSFQTIFSSDSLLCLVHESVEGVVEGVHEVGVVDWGLGAWKATMTMACHFKVHTLLPVNLEAKLWSL